MLPTGVVMRHYTAEPFVFDRARVYSTKPEMWKPHGLWVSVERGEDDDFRGWKQWCEREDFGLGRLRHAADVTLSPDANVLLIDNEGSLRKFHARFHGASRMDGIEWYLVQSQWDGIVIAPMIWSCRLELLWYYGWDCSSGCIWNLGAIESIDGLPVRTEA